MIKKIGLFLIGLMLSTEVFAAAESGSSFTNYNSDYNIFTGQLNVFTNSIKVSNTVTATSIVTTNLNFQGMLVATNIATDDDVVHISVSGGISNIFYAVPHKLHYTGQGNSPDSLTNYMGFPKLILNAGQVTASSSAGTAITAASFANAFDNNFTSVTSTGIHTTTMQHSYVIALTDNYIGFVVMNIISSNAAVSSFCVALGYGGPSLTAAAGIINAGTYEHAREQPDIFSITVGIRTNNIVKSFFGSKITVHAQNNAATASSYFIRDLSIYGVTNAYTSFTGTPQ